MRHLHHRPLRQGRPRRERPQQHELIQIVATVVHSVGTVELRPPLQQSAVGTEVLTPAGAVPAMAATRNERRDYVVARLDPRDTRSDGFDNPRPLVTSARRQDGHLVAKVVVDVTVAHPRRHHADQDLMFFGLVDFDIDYLPAPR